MKKILLTLLIVLLPLFAFTPHKFYISLIKIEHSEKSQSVQITMRIFIDDMQEVLQKKFGQTYELAVPDEPVEKINKDLNRYAQEKFEIQVNNQTKTFKFLGKEYENDVVYLYFEVTKINDIKEIKITDIMLTEQFPDQKNIIKIIAQDVKKTFFLTKKDPSDSLKFN